MEDPEEALDFEVPEEEFYCPVCLECFDEQKEFTDHTNTLQHNIQVEQRMTALKEGDSYCSLCVLKITDSFEIHCATSDHCQYLKSVKRGFPSMTDPCVEIYDSNGSNTSSKKSTSSAKAKGPKTKHGSLKDRIIANKCIGISHIERQDNLWFCDLCLEKFPDDIDDHCTRARHAIQYIKLFDSSSAYKLKCYASQKHLLKKFQALASSKAIEIFEKEKDTPEFLRAVLALDKFEKDVQTVVKAEPKAKEQEKTKEVSPPLTVEAVSVSIDLKNQAPDPSEVILFEEEDRSFIPESEADENSGKANKITRPTIKPMTADDSTMIVGIKHLTRKGREYYCQLCDVMCKASLHLCKSHMTSSLHRRKMIIRKFTHPVPNYLEKIRQADTSLYTKLISIEAQKIELEERENECPGDMNTRAGILSVSNILALPEPLSKVKALTSEEKALNLKELAKQWDDRSNRRLFGQKSGTATPSAHAGLNKSAISPIRPQIEDLLVGVSFITLISGSMFNCSLCKIKFNILPKRKDRAHVSGRLHKTKALSSAYGNEVDEYLKHHSKKGGYKTISNLVNQACVLLEKEEIEAETPQLREIRAKILGVKVEQIPLPMITMSNEEPFDVKKAALEWKTGKKVPLVTKNTTCPLATKHIPVATTEAKTSAANAAEEAVPPVKQDKSPGPEKIDVQPGGQSPKPSEILVEVKNDKAAKNIFDLCKPMPSTTPEKKVFKSTKSPASIKNIDIDILRKSLVDADFIPVEKTQPESAAADQPAKETQASSSVPAPAVKEAPATNSKRPPVRANRHTYAGTRTKLGGKPSPPRNNRSNQTARKPANNTMPNRPISQNRNQRDNLKRKSPIMKRLGDRGIPRQNDRGERPTNQCNSNNRGSFSGNNFSGNNWNNNNVPHARQNIPHGNSRPSNNPVNHTRAPATEGLNIDMNVRNTHLANALAKVTDLRPLNQACNMRINQTTDNWGQQGQQQQQHQFQQGGSNHYNNSQQHWGNNGHYGGNSFQQHGGNSGNYSGGNNMRGSMEFERENLRHRDSGNFGHGGNVDRGHGGNVDRGRPTYDHRDSGNNSGNNNWNHDNRGNNFPPQNFRTGNKREGNMMGGGSPQKRPRGQFRP